jgi:hypothetical protein
MNNTYRCEVVNQFRGYFTFRVVVTDVLGNEGRSEVCASAYPQSGTVTWGFVTTMINHAQANLDWHREIAHIDVLAFIEAN